MRYSNYINSHVFTIGVDLLLVHPNQRRSNFFTDVDVPLPAALTPTCAELKTKAKSRMHKRTPSLRFFDLKHTVAGPSLASWTIPQTPPPTNMNACLLTRPRIPLLRDLFSTHRRCIVALIPPSLVPMAYIGTTVTDNAALAQGMLISFPLPRAPYLPGQSISLSIIRFIDAPIFHVNGDNTEAITLVCQLAADYRAKYKRDRC